MNNVPVIVIALANENTDRNRRLEQIEREAELIKSGLQAAVDEGLCEVVIIQNTTIDKLLSIFRENEYKNRIAIFHYAGHADGYQLLLETESGENETAHGDGLVSFLSRQESLELVFLNGCSTEEHAEQLINKGTSAVIGTSNSISDEIAMGLAVRFYKVIGAGLDIRTSWNDAIDNIKISYGSESWRSPNLSSVKILSDRYPWSLYIRKGAEQVNLWNLPDASKNPLFRLPKLNEKYYESMPYPPFRYLKYYQQEDAATFFGRGYEIRDLYESIHSNNSSIILLYGKSGVGKSSLLNAGLIPYIENDYEVLYLRRDENIGISQMFFDSVSAMSDHPNNLKEAYEKVEFNINKPLVTILDQIDEYETKPINSKGNEIDDLIKYLSEIQGNISGKVVLSYRKEYHADIEKKLKDKKIAFSAIYLKPLNKDGVIEAVQGLERNSRTREFYNYSVEGLNDGSSNDLASLIADDLLEDRSSPISPLLQIHLSNLWDTSQGYETKNGVTKKVQVVKGDVVKFTAEQYQKIGKTNLNDFFNERTESIKLKDSALISSGLALEVLNQHTTKFGTAQSCKISATESDYKYFPSIRSVTDTLVDNYLLSKIDEESTILAHDTLGVIVLSNYATSDSPAQRVRRIISNKTANSENTVVNVLDDHDLGEVEAALSLGSVRTFTQEEDKLFTKSITARTKRRKAKRRRKQLGFAAVSVIASVAVIATYYFFQADEERSRAFNQINTANSLIENIQGDLRDKLQVINRLDIMSDVQKAVDKYHSDSSNIIKGTSGDLLISSRRQTVRNQIDGADILFGKGDSDKALQAYASALAEIIEINVLAPNDNKWKSNEGLVNLKIAQIYIQRNDFNNTYAYSKEALKIINELLEREPNNNFFKRDLVSVYDSFSSAYSIISDYSQALSYRENAIKEIDGLIKSEPNNIDYVNAKILLLSKKSSVYEKADSIRKMVNMFDDAPEQYRGAVSDENWAIFEEMKKVVTYPCNEDCLDLALNGHLQALSAMEDLVNKNPENNLFYQKTVLMYQDVSSTYHSMGDNEKANQYHQFFIKYSNELLRRNPGHAEHHLLIAEGYFSQGNKNREGKDFDRAKNNYAQGLSIIEKLLENDPNNTTLQRVYQGQSTIYNGLDASKIAYDLLKEAGMEK